jgi:uncharacterized membrane protein YbaN (DUF454 family)
VGRGPVRKAARSRQNSDASSDGPQIEIDSKARALSVRDPRLINASQRAFCRRLLETVASRPGIRKAEVDLPSATCRIQFASGKAGSQGMADLFADCVRLATASSARAEAARESTQVEAWTNMTAYSLSDQVSLWETLDAKPGQVQVRHQFPSGDEPQLPDVARAISGLDEVESCHAAPHSKRLTIDFHSKTKELNGFVDRAEQSLEDLLASADRQRGALAHAKSPADGTGLAIATGPKRLMFLVLAGGSFVMTLVGLVIPGVPTVPFLLATSYFLSRSSRRLHDWLCRSAFFGPILIEWDEHGGLSQFSKLKLIALAGAIVVVTVVLAPLTPAALAAVLLVASLGTFGVIRLPGVPRDIHAEDPAVRSARFALPSL